eukprot:TRINITY_DN891_c0_g1_i1.p1 TRINITY_DN891_c0_g1~~TRINITY_DN891_c0_g1_i1.p1  ORF type:complete len:219 (-),score=25.61 TRINITY_DN891_c0_g1_i1:259-915(-)
MDVQSISAGRCPVCLPNSVPRAHLFAVSRESQGRDSRERRAFASLRTFPGGNSFFGRPVWNGPRRTAGIISSSLSCFPNTGVVSTSVSRPALQPCSALSSTDGFTEVVAPLLQLAEISPQQALVAASLLGPFLSVLNLLFIVRIVMSWYPQLPANEFPYILAVAPTEPVLGPTRRLIPPVGGVDISPIIWVALLSFISEITVGQQGILNLISQQTLAT